MERLNILGRIIKQKKREVKTMKKIFILLLMMILVLTGCQKKETSNVNEEKQTIPTTTELSQPEFISATYVTEFESETLNDDFYVFNEDGTFYRQNNFCACYYVVEGTYEIVKKDDKKIINLKPNDDIERHLEYKDNIISFIDETDDSDINNSRYHQGCNFFMNDFTKTDNKNVVYKKAHCSE